MINLLVNWNDAIIRVNFADDYSGGYGMTMNKRSDNVLNKVGHILMENPGEKFLLIRDDSEEGN